jgi:hypothetical protein
VDDLFSLARWLCVGSFLLLALGLVHQHQPNSPLRTIALRFLAGAAVFVPLYVVSTVDVMLEAALGPFGLVDDAAAVVLDIAAARYVPKDPNPGDNSRSE